MFRVCTPSSMMCMYRRFGGMSERTHYDAPGVHKSQTPVCSWRLGFVRWPLFKAYAGGRVWKAIGDGLEKPCFPSKDAHNRRIKTRKQRTDVGKYFFVIRAIKSWNQLPAGLLASFPCKLNTFRKMVKILFLSFRRVVNVIYSFLGNSPASEI